MFEEAEMHINARNEAKKNDGGIDGLTRDSPRTQEEAYIAEHSVRAAVLYGKDPHRVLITFLDKDDLLVYSRVEDINFAGYIVQRILHGRM